MEERTLHESPKAFTNNMNKQNHEKLTSLEEKLKDNDFLISEIIEKTFEIKIN